MCCGDLWHRYLPQVQSAGWAELPSNLAIALFALVLGVIHVHLADLAARGLILQLAEFSIGQSAPIFPSYSSLASSPTGEIGWPASRMTASSCGSGSRLLLVFVAFPNLAFS